MRDLVRTWQPIQVRVPGRGQWQVDPPPLRIALAVLCAAQIAEDAPEEATRLLKKTLARWLSPRLGSLLTCTSYPVRDAMEWAVAVVEAGAPEPKELRTGEEEATWEDINWPGRIADYCAAYGISHEEALDVPFGRFLVMLKEAPRIHARAQLRQLQAQSLPHAEEGDREKIMRGILRRAGHEPEGQAFSEMTMEEKLDLQRKMLAKRNEAMGRA